MIVSCRENPIPSSFSRILRLSHPSPETWRGPPRTSSNVLTIMRSLRHTGSILSCSSGMLTLRGHHNTMGLVHKPGTKTTTGAAHRRKNTRAWNSPCPAIAGCRKRAGWHIRKELLMKNRVFWGASAIAAAALVVSVSLAAQAETKGPVTDDLGVVEIPKGDPIVIGG